MSINTIIDNSHVLDQLKIAISGGSPSGLNIFDSVSGNTPNNTNNINFLSGNLNITNLNTIITTITFSLKANMGSTPFTLKILFGADEALNLNLTANTVSRCYSFSVPYTPSELNPSLSYSIIASSGSALIQASEDYTTVIIYS